MSKSVSKADFAKRADMHLVFNGKEKLGSLRNAARISTPRYSRRGFDGNVDVVTWIKVAKTKAPIRSVGQARLVAVEIRSALAQARGWLQEFLLLLRGLTPACMDPRQIFDNSVIQETHDRFERPLIFAVTIGKAFNQRSLQF